MKLAPLAATWRAVAQRASRREKIEHLADLLRALSDDEVPVAVAWLTGELRQGRIGLGRAALRAAQPPGAAAEADLELLEVDAAFEAIAGLRGAGSAAARARRLRAVLERATAAEQEFLVALVLGELRQGALEGVMADAVARAAGVDAAAVRRGLMLAGDLRRVAAAVLLRGAGGLAEFALRPLSPVKPMLARTAADVDEALRRCGRAALEFKLDGARVQVHRLGGEVRVFSRRLNDVTAAVPEIVEAAKQLGAAELILDGEVLAVRADGRPLPFQTTMRRFGRRLDVQRLRHELPLSGFFFDCLYLDGEPLIDLPAADRFTALERLLPESLRMPRAVAGGREEAEAFLQRALAAGHEGVMAKSLEAGYAAGARGSGWLKIKPARSLDLVVLAAEWGSGRRRGWLSNLHLGARDPGGDGFVMLGKTFKGMTDETLAWQTQRLQELAVARDRWVVQVRPALVAEIAFDGVQESPHYPGGLALRFARLKRYRLDKSPEDADTIEAVRAIHRGIGGS